MTKSRCPSKLDERLTPTELPAEPIRSPRRIRFNRRLRGAEVSRLVSSPAFDSETVDPIELLGGAPRSAEPQPVRTPVARDLDNVSVTEEHFEPPRAVPDPTLPDASSAIPAGYDPLADSRFAAPPTPPQSRRVTPASSAGDASVSPRNYDPLSPDDTKPLFPAAPVERLHKEPEQSLRKQPVGEPAFDRGTGYGQCGVAAGARASHAS